MGRLGISLKDIPNHRNYECDLTWIKKKKVFVDIIKYREMRPSWITQVGLKSNDRCPYKRQRKEVTGKREDSHVKTEADITVMQPQAKKS